MPINRSTDQPINRSIDRSAGLPAIGLAPALFANQMRHGRFTLFDDVASQIHAGNHDAGVQTPFEVNASATAIRTAHMRRRTPNE
ncbi:hypothetical protein [Xanthomonas campestris]|uniref:hypothetical protein n=1 Tax=Xanthomonas campestris TaxID=339 RepID=UPI0016042902|nr:hypothetical protein [Xanthomonas campestris]